MSGTRVTCEDVDTGETETQVICDDWVVITDGSHYIDAIVRHRNGTVQVTIKVGKK